MMLRGVVRECVLCCVTLEAHNEKGSYGMTCDYISFHSDRGLLEERIEDFI